MVGFDFVKTRTLAYVQSYDWLPIIVQFSKICYQLAPLHSKCCLNWRLDYNNIMTTFMSTHFIIFFEVLFELLSVLLHSLRNSRSNDCMHIIVQWKYNRNPQFSILQNLHFIFIFNYKPNNWFYTINHVQCSCNKELSAQISFLLLEFTNMNITLL